MFRAEDITPDKSTEHLGDFAVDQVRSRQFFVPEPLRIKSADEQFNDYSGVHDLHSPRPSCSTDKIVSRSARPSTARCVRRMTAALCRTT
ncbi:hypothetical protein MALGJ_09750 [Mycolicibacter algericus]|uniref:Uncharacterized protein n=1 Tax=Mycolicibacter algericus TaxID=1288388 RepID=A0A7I9Y6I6_MYCAL|nr:hypothetical protein MALGJ_09750 [Mycolicibacter algericus]